MSTDTGTCNSRQFGTELRCQKPTDHADFHWHVTSNSVQVWDAFRERVKR